MNIKLKLEGYLKGGYPVNEEDIDMISELDFYGELIDLISNSEEEKAIDLPILITLASAMVNLGPPEARKFTFISIESGTFLNSKICMIRKAILASNIVVTNPPCKIVPSEWQKNSSGLKDIFKL